MQSRAAFVSQDDFKTSVAKTLFKEEHFKGGNAEKSKEWDNCVGGGLSGKNIAFRSSDHNGIPRSVRLRPQKRGEF